jgi:hypothetical protein
LSGIRRLDFASICRKEKSPCETGLVRNTVRDRLRQPRLVEPAYAEQELIMKLDACADALSGWFNGETPIA